MLEEQPVRTNALRVRRVGEQQGGIVGDRIRVTRLLNVEHAPGDQASTLRQNRGTQSGWFRRMFLLPSSV